MELTHAVLSNKASDLRRIEPERFADVLEVESRPRERRPEEPATRVLARLRDEVARPALREVRHRSVQHAREQSLSRRVLLALMERSVLKVAQPGVLS